MSEQLVPKSYEDRIANCPIHGWADIDAYLERAEVPIYLRRPFHELVLTRGKYPKYMSAEQVMQFAKRAVLITQQNEIQPSDARPLRIMFSQLIGQWIVARAERN